MRALILIVLLVSCSGCAVTGYLAHYTEADRQVLHQGRQAAQYAADNAEREDVKEAAGLAALAFDTTADNVTEYPKIQDQKPFTPENLVSAVEWANEKQRQFEEKIWGGVEWLLNRLGIPGGLLTFLLYVFKHAFMKKGIVKGVNEFKNDVPSIIDATRDQCEDPNDPEELLEALKNTNWAGHLTDKFRNQGVQEPLQVVHRILKDKQNKKKKKKAKKAAKRNLKLVKKQSKKKPKKRRSS